MFTIARGHEFSPEEQALLMLARPCLSDPDVEECRDLLTEHMTSLDWGRIIDLAGRHRVLPLISANLTDHRLFHSAEGKAFVPYHYLFSSVYRGNRIRNEALMAENSAVIAAVAATGVPFAVRKGPSLAARVYGGVGKRRMHDLDLLIQREDGATVREALASVGYAEGKLSGDGATIEPYSRRTQTHWRLHATNGLPQLKISGRDDITVYTVDLCFSLVQPAWKARLDTGAVLSRAVTAPDGVSRWLAPIDQLLDLCAHMFKEATTLYYIENGADIQLQKYVDLAGSCPTPDNARDWSSLVKAAHDSGIEGIVFYALYQLTMLYDGLVPDDVLDRLRPADLSYLDEYGQAEGMPDRWDSTFRQRLFADRRAVRAGITSPLPRG